MILYVYYTMFFRFREKEGELPHINGSIEADSKAVGLMQHPPSARGNLFIYIGSPLALGIFFKDLIIKYLENKK